jgi:glycogen debranching enzyme
VSDGRERLVALAARQLAANRLSGLDVETGLAYDFVCPSVGTYPFQWFWDSCFHAIALTHIDVALAEQELRCLLQGARPDGFVPHMQLWTRAAHRDALAAYNLPTTMGSSTVTMQPPLLATAVRRVWEAGRSATFLQQVLPATARYYDWLAANRDPDGDELISILQPDESGMDASHAYDVPLRLEEPTEAGLRAALDRLFAAYAPLRDNPAKMFAAGVFAVEDVLVNTMYAEGLRDLAALFEFVGEPARAAGYALRAEQVEHSLFTRSWDGRAGGFWSLGGANEEPLRVLTVASLAPLLLEQLPREMAAALVTHLTDPTEFWTPYPCPTAARSEPAYAPGEGIIWRGPTWLNTNWMLVRGLRRHGYDQIAEQIATASRELVLQHGFREYYDPVSGEPGGARGFGWSTLVIDM